MKGKCCVF